MEEEPEFVLDIPMKPLTYEPVGGEDEIFLPMLAGIMGEWCIAYVAQTLDPNGRYTFDILRLGYLGRT